MVSRLLVIVVLISAHIERGCWAWCSKTAYVPWICRRRRLSSDGAGCARNDARIPPSFLLTPTTTQNFLAPQQLGSFETLSDEIRADRNKNERGVLLKNYVNNSQHYDFNPEASESIPFETAWGWQKSCLEQQLNRIQLVERNSDSMPGQDAVGPFLPQSLHIHSTEQDNSWNSRNSINGIDTVYMLQHSPVYTLGTGSDERFVLALNSDGNNVPIVRMDRGGEVTYHGPGQLTVYPILDLRNYRQDIHWYMRALEEAILIAISKVPGLGPNRAVRQDDTTGIWIDNFKVAAVGIKCKRWVTMHGLAVNVEHSCLNNFAGIVPCGLEGRKVGCLNQFIPDDKPKLTVTEFAKYMEEALEEVFCIQLVEA